MIQRNSKIIIGVVILITSIYTLFIHFNDNYQVALCKNEVTGEVFIDTVRGVRVTPFWVRVTRIDTRPIKLCIDCKCSNVNCKLIQFDYNNYKEFIKREKFCYFWWKNRLSYNISQENEYRGIKFILRTYTFDEKEYKFIKKL